MEKKSINFWTYYENLESSIEKRNLRNVILTACNVEYTTFYNWLSKKKVPKWQLTQTKNAFSSYLTAKEGQAPEEISFNSLKK